VHGSAQQQQQQQIAPPASQGQGQAPSPPELLSDLDPDNVSRELKKEGSDWFAVWSSQSKKMLDVGLVHTLNHET
jgi:glucose repression regulatory protein TUP1